MGCQGHSSLWLTWLGWFHIGLQKEYYNCPECYYCCKILKIGKSFFTQVSPTLLLFVSLTYTGPLFNLLHFFLIFYEVILKRVDMKILGILAFKGCSVISKLHLFCLTVQIKLSVNSILKFVNSINSASKLFLYID